MRKFLLFAAGLFAATALRAQDAVNSDVWKALSSVSYEVAEDDYGEMYVPQFRVRRPRRWRALP